MVPLSFIAQIVCERILKKRSSLGRLICGKRGMTNAKTDMDVNEMSRPPAWLECRVRAAEWQEAREAGTRHIKSSDATPKNSEALCR